MSSFARVARRRRDVPWFVLIGGINGAGKSTFGQNKSVIAHLGGDIEFINPDLVTRELREANPVLDEDEANLAAADECEARVKNVLAAGMRSIAIETVLSSPKYVPIVTLARAHGYRFMFIYVLLGSVDEAIARVAKRHNAGGHNVPEYKIRARWPRTLANCAWFWEQADKATVYFNGDAAKGTPVLLADKGDRGHTFHPAALPVLMSSR